MNVTIIGCGYVGKAVARRWSQELGLTVTATTTTPEKVSELQAVAKRVILLKGNDVEGLKSVLENQETVLVSVGAGNANLYEEAYLQTAKNLVSVMPQIPTLRQLIYTSSYAVYGDKKGEWVDEETPVSPTTPNTEILSKTEQLLLAASRATLKVCILRLGGIYGPGRTLFNIFSRVAGSTRPGKGDEPTNWIHLEDIVGVIEFVRQHHLQGIYNLVDDDKSINREFLNRLMETHYLPPLTWDESLPSSRSYNAKVSNEKLKQAGYRFLHPQRIFS